MPFSPTSAHSWVWMPMASSCVGAEAQLVQLAHGVGLQVDAHAERLERADRLQHEAGHADLVQGQREAQAADAGAGDQDRWWIQRLPSISTKAMRAVLCERLAQAWLVPRWMSTSPARSSVSPSSITDQISPSSTMA